MAGSDFVSDDCLLDTSWSLFRVSNIEWSARDIRNTNTFALPARNLNSLLQRTAKGGADYDEEDSDRAGGFNKTSWKLIDPIGHSQAPRGILITVEYERSSYKAILLRQSGTTNGRARFPLLLIRMPTTLSRRFIKFLELDFLPSATVAVQPLKLPTPLLCSVLESYIHILSTLPSARALPSYSRDTALQDLPSQMIRDLRITLSFSGPVAPHLRSLDLDIPFDTVWKLIKPGVEDNMGSKESTGFLQRLAGHIDRTTGLSLPWSTNAGDGAELRDGQDIIRVSRFTCASLVIAADGKFKLVGKFAEAIQDDEMLGLVTRANIEIIDALLQRAIVGNDDR